MAKAIKIPFLIRQFEEYSNCLIYYQCVEDCFETFEQVYEERFEIESDLFHEI